MEIFFSTSYIIFGPQDNFLESLIHYSHFIIVWNFYHATCLLVVLNFSIVLNRYSIDSRFLVPFHSSLVLLPTHLYTRRLTTLSGSSQASQGPRRKEANTGQSEGYIIQGFFSFCASVFVFVLFNSATWTSAGSWESRRVQKGRQ